MLRYLCYGCVLAAAVGCGRPLQGAAPPRSVVALASKASEPAAAEAPSRVDLAHALIVGSDERLEAWAVDGGTHQTLSPGPALHPRRIAPDAVLALSTEALAEGAQLVRISLRDGSRKVLATLPPFACTNVSPGDQDDGCYLAVQDADGFSVDATRKLACLELMDRNTNMASLELRVRIELDSGRLQRWLTMGEQACKPPAGVSIGEPSAAEWCADETELPHAPPSSPDLPFDFDEESGWIVKRGSKPTKVKRLRDHTLRQVSPSGRWLVLAGEVLDGDYMHFSLLLCDRRDGALYPVRAEPGPWPTPLTAATKVPTKGMADVVGESDVRWITLPGSPEMLIVDQLVVTPFAASWAFEGELARE